MMTRNPLHPRCGFSFAEVLFAVAVLGIGFIMVAAIFPVAIKQTQLAMEETVGTATARNGLAYLQGTQFLNATNLGATTLGAPATPTAPPSPGAIFSFRDPRLSAAAAPIANDVALWNSVKQSLIVTNDQRFAVIPLYSRDTSASFAKLILFSVHVRNRAQFDSKATTPNVPDFDRKVADTCADLEPRPVRVVLEDRTIAGLTDRMWISQIPTADYHTGMEDLSQNSNAEQAAIEGAYVVISDDRVADDTGTGYINENGKLNGRVYQLGPEVVPANAAPVPAGSAPFREFELVPGGDMASDKENLPGATTGSKAGIAWVVGRGYADPNNPGGGYAGSAMVVQRYENVISLK